AVAVGGARQGEVEAVVVGVAAPAIRRHVLLLRRAVDVPVRLQAARLALRVNALLAGNHADTRMGGGAIALHRLVSVGDSTVREAALTEKAVIVADEDGAHPDDGEAKRSRGEQAFPAHHSIGMLVVVQGDARGPFFAFSDWHGSAV